MISQKRDTIPERNQTRVQETRAAKGPNFSFSNPADNGFGVKDLLLLYCDSL